MIPEVRQRSRQVVFVTALQFSLPFALDYLRVLRNPEAVRDGRTFSGRRAQCDVCSDDTFSIFTGHARENLAPAIDDLCLAKIMRRIRNGCLARPRSKRPA